MLKNKHWPTHTICCSEPSPLRPLTLPLICLQALSGLGYQRLFTSTFSGMQIFISDHTGVYRDSRSIYQFYVANMVVFPHRELPVPLPGPVPAWFSLILLSPNWCMPGALHILPDGFKPRWPLEGQPGNKQYWHAVSTALWVKVLSNWQPKSSWPDQVNHFTVQDY